MSRPLIMQFFLTCSLKRESYNDCILKVFLKEFELLNDDRFLINLKITFYYFLGLSSWGRKVGRKLRNSESEACPMLLQLHNNFA